MIAPPPPACSLCGAVGRGERVFVGPALGDVHRACFIPWDQLSEAEELGFPALPPDLLEAERLTEEA